MWIVSPSTIRTLPVTPAIAIDMGKSVYQRSDLLDQRRAAMDKWAQHIEGIIKG
jgi:hypothetical protein